MMLYYLHLILTLEEKSVSYTRKIDEKIDTHKDKEMIIQEKGEIYIPETTEMNIDEDKKYILLLSFEEYHTVQKTMVTRNNYAGAQGFGREPFQSKIT